MNNRILALDALRGLAIFIMIFVDASPGEIYSIFRHADWEGLTVADFAFAGFVFAMGASAAVSMSRRQPSMRKIFRRTAILFAIGILFNILQDFLELLFHDYFTVTNFIDAIINLRFFGILQRLALTYLCGMLITMTMRNDVRILIAAFVLLIVSSLGYHIYSPENPFAQSHNLSGTIDLFFGANHIYTPTHDPEGLYGTIASTASMLFGFFAGKILIDATPDKIRLLIIFGVILLLLGAMWTYFDIIAKQIWTSPFALITSGVGMILSAGLLYAAKKIPQPLYAFGRNPLLIFLASNFLLILFCVIQIDGISLWVWLWERTVQGFISVEFSSALFCLLWCMLWTIPAQILNRLGIVVKI